MLFTIATTSLTCRYAQACADVFQKLLLIADCSQTVALGAATLALCAYKGGRSEDLENATQRLAPGKRHVHPRAEYRQFHEQKYKRFKYLSDAVFHIVSDEM